MNGEFRERAQACVDHETDGIRSLKSAAGIQALSTTTGVALQKLQIELDEETADRMVNALDLVTIAIEDLTTAVKAHQIPFDAVRTHGPDDTVQVVVDDDTVDESLGDA